MNWRVVLFLGLVTGSIFWLHQKSIEVEKEVGVSGWQGEKVLGEQALSFPNVIGSKATESLREILIRESERSKTIQEMKLRLERMIEKINEELRGAPSKQERQLRRKIIQEVCQTLLKEVEEDE